MKIRGNTIGTTIKPEKVLVKSENLTEAEKVKARANIGAASMLVVTEGAGGKASHNAKEIFAHVQAGGMVVFGIGFEFGSELYASFVGGDNVHAHFIFFEAHETNDDHVAVGAFSYFTIDMDGNIDSFGMSVMDAVGMQNYITEQVGSIDTALDSILKIQNELIGGDGV